MATLAVEDETAAEPVPAPPRKRALPFKRTVARRNQASAEPKDPDDDNDLDFFRHSKEVFPEILQEVEQEAKKALAAEDEQHARKRKKVSPASGDEHASQQRRSSTLDTSDDDVIMDVKGKGREILRTRRPSTPAKPASARATPQTPASTRSASRRSSSRLTEGSQEAPVTIPDSDESEAEVKPAAARTQQRNSTQPTTQPTAPNHKDRRPSAAAASSSSSPIETLDDKASLTATDLPSATDDFSEWVAKARALQAAQSQQQAPVIQVLVSSRLPQLKRAVVMRRRLNQGVQLLLDVWLSQMRGRHGFAIPDDVAASLFLSWKGRKIYGNSTLASLGVRVDAHGRVRPDASGEGYARGGIELEVWTDEAHAEHMAAQRQRRALLPGVDDHYYGGDGGAVAAAALEGGGGEREATLPPAAQPKKKGFRIVLKARDHEPLRMTAREDTDVETLVEAFRAQRGIGPEWEVAVWFDGERLDEDALIADMDVDPDEANQLEVHIKKVGG